MIEIRIAKCSGTTTKTSHAHIRVDDLRLSYLLLCVKQIVDGVMIFFPDDLQGLQLVFGEIVIWAQIVSPKIVFQNRIDDWIGNIAFIDVDEAKE